MTAPNPRSLDELKRMVEARKAEKATATSHLLVTATLIADYAKAGVVINPGLWRDYEQRSDAYGIAAEALMAAYDAVDAESNRLAAERNRLASVDGAA